MSIFLCFVFISCQTGKEVHYFRSGDNYYRLRIHECAFLSSSRYVAGYFDENAVTNYFNEMHRPDSTARIVPINQTAGTTSDASQTNSPKTCNSNVKFVMILSTNSDVVAQQIGNLADNEQTLDLLARMANKNVIKDNQLLKL